MYSSNAAISGSVISRSGRGVKLRTHAFAIDPVAADRCTLGAERMLPADSFYTRLMATDLNEATGPLSLELYHEALEHLLFAWR